MAVGTRMQQRRATAAVWNTSGYVLAAGELGVATDTKIIKIGDGVNAWSALDPAFDDLYLPILGTAANSDLLGGISASSFVKVADTDVLGTNNTYVKRTADGGVKATDATEATEVTTLQQQTAAILAGKQLLVSQTVTAAATLALTDANSIVYVNHSSLTAQVQITVPPNASVAFPVGTIVQVTARGAGGAKIIAGAGVTINGDTNAMPGWGSVRLIKYSTNTWFGMGINSGKRLPTIKSYRSVGGQSYASYTAVPYDVVDAAMTYNPDNEWFSYPGTGMTTSRRIICNKDGEYEIEAHFSHSGSPSVTWMRIVKMVADATDAGGRIIAINPVQVVGSCSITQRATAGDSFGLMVGALAGSTDSADPIAGGGLQNPNNFRITRLGD